MNSKSLFLLMLIAALASFLGCKKEELPEEYLEELPEISTSKIECYTSNSAVCKIRILNNISPDNLTGGVVWAKHDNPTHDNAIWGYSTNRFWRCPYLCVDTYINNLEPNTVYYIRSFAINKFGTAYGNTLSFTTREAGIGDSEVEYGEFIDSRDGNTYSTVQIGSQVWMAENLKYLPRISASSSLSRTEPHYYVYGYDGVNVAEAIETNNYKTYGVLYNWPAAMKLQSSSESNPSGVQGICPSGWHMPSANEWDELENYLANNGFNYDGSFGGVPNKVAKSMASNELWDEHYTFGTVGADSSWNNLSGFSALPGGKRSEYSNHTFDHIGSNGNWWTASEEVGIHLWFDHSGIYSVAEVFGEMGYSVRCVQD